jgi:hypothetical protein
MPPVTEADLDNIFSYHAPNSGQQICYGAIRESAKEFAAVLLKNTPVCADQQAAIRKLREVVMTANAAVALKGAV